MLDSPGQLSIRMRPIPNSGHIGLSLVVSRVISPQIGMLLPINGPMIVVK